MKILNTFKPAFNPTAKTLDFSLLPGFSINKLYAVINVTQGVPIYVAGASGLGVSANAGSVITLSYDTSTHSGADSLNIYYEASHTSATELNMARESGGQLQTSNETLNMILVELQVISNILAVGLNITDDLDNLRGSVTAADLNQD